MSAYNQTQNTRGEWVPAIPEPFYGALHVRCWECVMEKAERRVDVLSARTLFAGVFLTRRCYREHYALVHILGLS